MIQIENFSKNYGNYNAVKDVSFTAKSGSITGLLGVNGAGKTTILKAICGLHYATKGRVLVHGIDVAENPVKVKEMIGFVSEQPAFFPNFTVKSFLNYSAKIRLGAISKEYSKKEIIDSVQNVCEQCSLEPVFYKKIHELSKGYRQRLSFAQALIHNPSVIVLDEPITGLDPAQIKHMRQLIKKLSESKTILISTHLMQEVEALCQTVHIINQGKLVASGTSNEIIEKTGCSSFEEAFLFFTEKTGASNEF